MLPSVNTLILDQQDSVLTIWFNRPEVKNALSEEMASELALVFEALASLPAIRFVVLRGKGGTFCSGGDLKAFKAAFQTDGDAREHRQQVIEFNAGFGRTLHAVEALPQLFIVAIEGAAMAGGLGLSCIADVVLTTADTKYALSEVTLGIPPAQITPLVIRRIGASQARRLLLTAQRFDGRQAFELGFAHILVRDTAELDNQLRQLIDRCHRNAPMALAATKQIINASKQLTGDELVNFAAERFADCLLSDEGREGLSAFAEKRLPVWAKPEEKN